MTDRTISTAQRLREIAEDIVGCACLFIALYGLLWIAPLLGGGQ